MNLSEARAYLQRNLLVKFEEREANNIAKFYLEDMIVESNNPLYVLHEAEIKALESDLALILTGMPLQYVTQKAWFYGMEFEVNSSVLIPRPETEELVDRLIKEYKDKREPIKILEIGTGSGCIAIAIAKHLPHTEIIAVDLSASALACAHKNAIRHNLAIPFIQLDWLEDWEQLLDEDFDLIVSNPPYISVAEKSLMGSSVLEHEPEEALFAGEDGLVFYKAIAEFASKARKKPEVYLELNEFKAEEIRALFVPIYESVEIHQDLQRKERILVGK